MTKSFRQFGFGFFFLILLLEVHSAYGQYTEDSFLSDSRQLIYEGKRSGEGYFSKSGRYLIFQSEREADNPFYQMYILDFETGDINRVSPGHGKTTCGYFNWADEKEVLFASSHQDPEARSKQKTELDFRASGTQRRYSWDYEPEMDIYTFSTTGQETKNLTQVAGYDAEASFSPDGKWIAFTSNRQAYEDNVSEEIKKKLAFDPSFYNEIYLMKSDGSDLHRLTDHNGYDGGPFFSPNGERIIWRRFNEKGDKADIFSMSIDGSDVKQLTDFKCMSWAPYYHPSQTYVLFASNKLGFSNFEIFMVDAAGTKEPIQVTYTDGFDGLPVFSPDGQKMVWTSNRTAEGKSQLFMANWDHEKALTAIQNAPPRGSAEGFQAEIYADELKTKVKFLASDELGGRMTGTKGAQQAADYIIDQLKAQGLQNLDGHDFRFPFEFSAEIEIDRKKTQLAYSDQSPIQKSDFDPFLFSDAGDVAGTPIFLGYGIATSENGGYDNYAGMDVNGKIVLIVEEIPESGDEEFDRQMKRYGAIRYRAMLAREAGASALIMIGKKRFQRKDALAASSGILAARVTPEVAQKWFKKENKNYERVTTALASFNPHEVVNFNFQNEVRLAISLKREKKIGQNIVGVIPAYKPTDQYIILGGHYDHLGLGQSGSLLADNNFNQIHNGADDNASGTSLLLELAESMAARKQIEPSLFTENILFAFWSGEELGLIGSDKFCEKLPLDTSQIKAYLNYDMVGRMKENKLILQGLGSSDGWKKIVERKNIVHGFNLVLQQDPYLPTDATSFYKKGIPVMSFFTGLHDDYHKPSDDPSTLNYQDLARITKFSEDIVLNIMQGDLKYQKVEISSSQQNIRGFNVYLGTIPDYAAEVQGVKLSGVRPGAPSDEAGLMAGDIIINLAGKEIRNIYDYTYILGELEIGRKENIVINRDGKTLNLEITPGSK